MMMMSKRLGKSNNSRYAARTVTRATQNAGTVIVLLDVEAVDAGIHILKDLFHMFSWTLVLTGNPWGESSISYTTTRLLHPRTSGHFAPGKKVKDNPEKVLHIKEALFTQFSHGFLFKEEISQLVMGQVGSLYTGNSLKMKILNMNMISRINFLWLT